MRRSTGLVRHKDPATRRVPAFHAHGCLGCARRYEDACTTPLVNGHCATCRFGHPPPQWDVNRLPQECCVLGSKPVTTAEDLVRYALGGNGRWWKCKKCSRTHPFKPEEDVA